MAIGAKWKRGARASPYPGEILFLIGEDSDDVHPEHYPTIGHCFPKVHIRSLHGAGQWLHVDQPEASLQGAREFFGDGQA